MTAQRLQKLLARAGVSSRRAAEQLILDGKVKVNGTVVQELGTKVSPEEDIVEVDGKPVDLKVMPQVELWALYKPKGCVTTMHDPQGRPTVAEYIPRSAGRLFPVGRLDYDAEGLLLLTNDGDLAQRVAHPRHSVEKVYLVKVQGWPEASVLAELRKGAMIDGKEKRPVKARILHKVNEKTWLEVALKEGTYHHIKKLFGQLGHRVVKIKRYSVGPIELEDMNPGDTRKLGQQVIHQLLEASGISL